MHPVYPPLLALTLFFGMLLMIEIGRRLGARPKPEGDGSSAGIGALEGSIFALMGLLIGFTFSGALTRFDSRRQLDVQEVNNIGTAYLRLDLLPEQVQPKMRLLFKQYVESRVNVYRKLPDLKAAMQEMAHVKTLQGEIWSQALAASKQAQSTPPTMLLMPALNAMIDITTTQTMAAQIHPPFIVYAMFFVLALVSSLLAGQDMARSKDRHWIHVVGFALVVSVSFYVILDLEYPRLGLIRMDAVNQAWKELLTVVGSS